ncbi:condensin-2 complex subunit H2 isoform X2 [Kryptolebias marmoratus]|uniref:Condensin-2 complex subunit H2 n=1 Tax=Kryptolebias marmoratus TaxID=37003 RepID=A0A3Q3AC55_KRYMA|nr:condensin-2 complex subunit H2 isoform X2 [Kryptolebias marmoratus]
MDPTENRFTHLLQPIRELTKNWEIDVASELNDYLEELDEMCITFDGGTTRLNFAEAALLIQGSTCIYSKKVELLHSLVYQTLEYISDRNKKRSKEAAAAAAAQEGDAGAMQSSHDSDNMAVFTPQDLEASENSQMSDSNPTVSVVPLPPESLIPPETHEKHKLPFISVKGEVVCSQKDFRTNLFIPGEENLILLTLRPTEASRFLLDQHPAVDAAEAAVQPHEDDSAADDAAQNFLPVDDLMELDQNPVEHIERNQAPSVAQMIRERRQVEKQMPQDEILPNVNIWTLHDLYASGAEERPVKSGKCYSVPDGLDDGGKRKRKRARTLQNFRTWFRGTFDPPEQKLKSGPTFPDLNYIYLSTLKDKVKTQKRINRKAGVVMSEEELRRTLLQSEEAGPQQQGEEPVDDFGHADLLGGDDNNDVFADDNPSEFVGGPDFILHEAQKDELTYEELVKLCVEQLVVNSRGYTQETALSRRVKDWKDQIWPELQLQEERPPLDIRDYGERIVTSLSCVGRRRSFASIVTGFDNFEVCKFLLASLQLANDHTVEVDAAAGLEDSLDTMSLTLLSTSKATDRFKTLTASI